MNIQMTSIITLALKKMIYFFLYQHLKSTAEKTSSLILSVGERMEKGHVKLYYDSFWYNSTVKSFAIRVRCAMNHTVTFKTKTSDQKRHLLK